MCRQWGKRDQQIYDSGILEGIALVWYILMVELEKKSASIIPAFLNEALGFNIYRAGLLFRRELAQVLKEYKITPEQWTVLATLWSTGKPINQSKIVQLTMKDKHTTSRIVKRLERDGWIEKRSDKKDGRSTLIHLTPKGNSLKNIIPLKVIKHFDILLEDYSIEEIQFLIDSLKKLRRTFGD